MMHLVNLAGKVESQISETSTSVYVALDYTDLSLGFMMKLKEKIN
jgi:hypothetical protein